MPTVDDQIRVRVPTPDGPYGAETLWADRMHGTADEAVIKNSPFFVDAPALNYGDLVRVVPEEDSDGLFQSIVEIIRPSGHRRVSVVIGDERLDARDLHAHLLDMFDGLIMEGAADPRSTATPARMLMLWVSVPPDQDVDDVTAQIALWLDDHGADLRTCGYDGPYESVSGPFRVRGQITD